MGKEKNAETIIGPSVHVEGNFQGAGDIIVEGSVQGTLKTTSDIRIGHEAKVKADLEGANLFVAGEVRGNIQCKGQLELTSSAKVHGNITCQTLIVSPGAILHGKSVMNNKEQTVGKEEQHLDAGRKQ